MPFVCISRNDKSVCSSLYVLSSLHVFEISAQETWCVPTSAKGNTIIIRRVITEQK